MRLEDPFVYEVHTVRQAPPLFRFLIEEGPIEAREAYATFNMGVGFAVFVRPSVSGSVIAAAAAAGVDAWIGGGVRREGRRKAVSVPSLNIVYEAETLQVR